MFLSYIYRILLARVKIYYTELLGFLHFHSYRAVKLKHITGTERLPNIYPTHQIMCSSQG